VGRFSPLKYWGQAFVWAKVEILTAVSCKVFTVFIGAELHAILSIPDFSVRLGMVMG
jgi:hypothetical protein